MKIVKISNFNTFDFASSFRYLKDIDTDLINLTLAMQSRIRLGDGTNGASGENISGEFRTFTSHASANTEFSVTHTIGSIPIGYFVIGKDKAGELYQLADTGTAWTSDTIYLKSTGTSVSYLIFLLK